MHNDDPYAPPHAYETKGQLFRTNVTGLFGIVTGDFGNVTGHFGNVTDRTGRQDWRCA
ncbi:hypothetical protein [Paraburkholderia kirstenboschensis]|uniref:Uncharacterized protein n=1 Tax=Paraburkholderia kirstenboschensis TaxID=1245436 RepID=A0ABZ0EAN9_9BURK|nr:hypothetical protein [Paraburkholderia kirstenboschensis]WOD14298.1 hypothetical protein RW095_02015 [Paraburkholderia kirstenboschensis]